MAKLNPSDYEFADLEQAQPQEGWGEYALRNVSKIPALTYSAARSGLGLGDLAYYLRGEEPGLTNTTLRALLPTYQEARGEASQVLPAYFSEQRPGDFPAEFLAELIPFAAASGVKTAGQAARYGVRALTGLGGAYLGGTAGEAIGGEPGRITGGILGGLVGAHNAPFQGKQSTIRPTRALYEAEKEAFETNKLKRLGEVGHKYRPRIAEFEKRAQEAVLGFPKEKNKFETLKRKEISTIQQELKDYNNQIKTLETQRAPLYKQAEKLGRGIKGSASNLEKLTELVGAESFKGVPQSDINLILNNLQAMESTIVNGKLSLADAKTLKQNFNDQIYDRNASVPFKRAMAPLVEGLNEFIVNEGGIEHLEPWLKAEEASKQLSQLKKGRKEFETTRNAEIRNIGKRTFDIEQKAALNREAKEFTKELKDLHAERGNQLDAIGKETYEKYLRSQDQRNDVERFFGTLVGENPKSKGLGALLTAAAYALGGWKGAKVTGGLLYGYNTLKNEANAAVTLFSQHPEYLKKVSDILKYTAPKDLPIARKALHSLDRELASLESSTLNPEEYEFA